MNASSPVPNPTHTRRQFLKTSSAAMAGAALSGVLARPGYAAENNTIKIALIGCGGRGTGAAAQAMSTQGPTKLWAMADVFPERLQGSLATLRQQHPAQVEASPERQFVGMDGFKKAVDSLDKGDVVVLATPPAFRPQHVEYAVEKGMHVFMEKSFGVDAPGVRRILKAGQEAKRKNLKIAGGLMSRHSAPLAQAIDQIHQGRIGDVITCYAYRMHGPVGFNPRKEGWSELAFQVANYSNFTWLNGSFILDWLIHNIDVCCWVKNAWPVAVQGMGGRQVREVPDQLFDHYMAEYSFADGTRMVAQGRHIANTWDFFGDVIHGTKGCAVLGEGQPKPRLFKGHNPASTDLIWSYKGPECNQYQVEHDLLFEAIRKDKPHNEAERCAKSCLAAIMGRMACESGKMVTWEEAMNSEAQLAPGLDSMTWESQPPVMPDARGHYPIAMPGQTPAV